MTPELEWPAIALRLALTVLASAAIGLNRGEQDRPVGLRTTMLVALAAAIAMIEVNALLPLAGRTSDSFVMLDLMRLPLGILSGMGFIGAGAIVRREQLVQGVTTAATLWYVTVMGLCFGGGQLGLGLAALALAIFVLWTLKWVERRIGRERRAELSISFDPGADVGQAALSRFLASGFAIHDRSIDVAEGGQVWTVRCGIRWREDRPSESADALVRELAARPGIIALHWRPLSEG